MATNLNISENQERVPLTVGSRGVLRSITPDDGSPYYVGARAYVTQTASGAIVTVIDKDGTTTATILNGTDGQDGQDGADGADGNGITDISLTGSSANVDEYTITYDDGTTETFYVTNGIDGQDGADGADGADGYSPTATVTKSGDTATITITDINGTTTASISDGASGTSAFEAEFGTTTYADVKDAYDNDEILICTVPDNSNTMVLQFVYFDDTNEIFFFAFPTSDGWYWTQLSNADGWDDGQFYFASTDVATQLRDGLMSALDWQKLDGIASGAEVNVQSDWNQSVNTADDYIKNKPTKLSQFTNDSGYITGYTETDPIFLASAAHGISSSDISNWNGKSDFSGSYNDLTDKPTIPTVNNATLTIQKNGTNVQTFTANASSNKTANITVPTAVSELTNDSGYITGYTETDPVFSASAASGITSSDISDWNAKSEVSVTRHTTSGTNIADLTIDGTTTKLYAPTGGGGGITDVEVDGTSVVTGGVAEIDLTGKSDVGHTHTKSAITDFPTNVSSFVNDSGYITGYTETDPIFTASAASGISSSDITAWNGKPAFGLGIPYGDCSTAGGTVQKEVSITGVTALTTGLTIAVKFTNANSASSPTLKVNTLTAKSIKRYGTTAPSTSAATSWNAGSVILLTYDGTYWQQIGFLNSTYSEISSANITNGSGSSTGLVSGRRAKSAVETFAPVKDVTVGGTSVMSGTTAVVPAIPTVNDATLTIQKNGTNVATFTANASSNVTADISVPTDTGDLTNGAGFITGYTETDPIFSASAASGISSSDISNWNGKSDFSGSYNDLTDKPKGYGSSVDITSYTSSSPYTVASDGVFQIFCTYRSNNYIQGYVDGVVLIQASTPASQNAAGNILNCVPVFKGQQIYAVKSSNYSYAYFYPYI